MSRIFQEKTFPRLESQQKNSAEFLLEVWKFKLVPGYQPNRETTTWKKDSRSKEHHRCLLLSLPLGEADPGLLV